MLFLLQKIRTDLRRLTIYVPYIGLVLRCTVFEAEPRRDRKTDVYREKPRPKHEKTRVKMSETTHVCRNSITVGNESDA